jgi:hypothetical protein
MLTYAPRVVRRVEPALHCSSSYCKCVTNYRLGSESADRYRYCKCVTNYKCVTNCR